MGYTETTTYSDSKIETKIDENKHEKNQRHRQVKVC